MELDNPYNGQPSQQQQRSVSPSADSPSRSNKQPPLRHSISAICEQQQQQQHSPICPCCSWCLPIHRSDSSSAAVAASATARPLPTSTTTSATAAPTQPTAAAHFMVIIDLVSFPLLFFYFSIIIISKCDAHLHKERESRREASRVEAK